MAEQYGILDSSPSTFAPRYITTISLTWADPDTYSTKPDEKDEAETTITESLMLDAQRLASIGFHHASIMGGRHASPGDRASHWTVRLYDAGGREIECLHIPYRPKEKHGSLSVPPAASYATYPVRSQKNSAPPNAPTEPAAMRSRKSRSDGESDVLDRV